jgi:hypothetical protein
MLTVEGLRLGDEDNSCVLLFDGELALNVEYDESEERLVFSIHIAHLPKENATPLLQELLAANLYWIGAGGATLALDTPSGSILMIHASRVKELDDAHFERIVENMLNMAERWRKRVVAHHTGMTQDPGPDAVSDSAAANAPPFSPPVYG